jgi:response regulator RpfG family c-di-GMP phosphodiesterase
LLVAVKKAQSFLPGVVERPPINRLFKSKVNCMKRHILLIDNNEQELVWFMDALREVPEDDGFKCTHANTIMQAVELLERLVPHYVFIERNLPAAETSYILQEIRSRIQLRHVKVFLYSRHEDSHAQHTVRSFGLHGLVKKSKRSDKLGQRLTPCFAD